MRNHLRDLFASPIFDNEEKTRTARFLNAFSWIAILTLLVMWVVRFFVWREKIGFSMMLIASFILILIAVQFIIRRGYVQSAGMFLIVSAWGVILYQAWESDGLRDATVIAYLVVTMLASLLLGWRGAFVIGMMSVASVWCFAWLEHQEFRAIHVDDPFSYARDLTVIFFLAGTLIYLLINNLNRSLQEARLELKERLRAEERLQKQAEYLTALHETALGLVNRLELKPLLESILTRASELLETPHVALNLVLPDESALKQELGYGLFVEFDGVLTSKTMGVVGRAWDRGEIVLVENYKEWDGRLPEVSQFEFGAVMAAPFRSGNKTIGVLLVAHVDQEKVFTDQQVTLLERFATLAALAIQNTRLHEQAQRELVERRSVESALSESEEKFRKIFQVSPVAICMTTLREGRFIEGNDAYWTMSGYDSKTTIGRTAMELEMWPTPEDRAGFVKRIQTERSIHNPNYVFSTPQGDSRTALAFYELIEIKGQPCILSMFYDVTPQREVQHALQASEERFRKVFETGQMAICIASLEEGTFIDANHAFWKLTGLDPTRSIGRTALELGMWNSPEERSQFVAEMIEKRSLKNVEVQFSGTAENRDTLAFYELVQLEEQECVLAMFYDITEQKQAQEALRDAEARTRALLTAIPDMIFEISREGMFKGYIPSTEIKPPVSPEQFIGRHIRELFPPRIADQTMFALERALATNQLHAFEYGMPPGEETQFFEARVSAISKELGLIMVRDISQRKWIETEREKLIEELEDKNAELERFTYTVSHDLKSPLITIKGFLGFIEQDASNGNLSRLKADIKRISDATDKMQMLLSELLELSRVGRLKNVYQETSLEQIAREAIELVHGRLQNARAEVHIQENLPVIYGDQPRLLEVLQNLVDNAAKFMGTQPHPMIEIGQSGQEDGKPIFFVRDNGIGIEPEHQDRIFGLFNKLDADTEGTGIGLTLVKRIVEVHGGRIWVHSEPGKGSSFFFTLQTEPES
jgi:two-component system sensor kinase FixL